MKSEISARTQYPKDLDALYRKLMSLFQSDLPVTFLYPMTWTHVAHRRVHGLSTPWQADSVWSMEHLRLDQSP